MKFISCLWSDLPTIPPTGQTKSSRPPNDRQVLVLFSHPGTLRGCLYDSPTDRATNQPSIRSSPTSSQLFCSSSRSFYFDRQLLNTTKRRLIAPLRLANVQAQEVEVDVPLTKCGNSYTLSPIPLGSTSEILVTFVSEMFCTNKVSHYLQEVPLRRIKNVPWRRT